MSIVVYWLTQGQPSVQIFQDDQLLAALAFSEAKRKEKDADGRPLHNHVVPIPSWETVSVSPVSAMTDRLTTAGARRTVAAHRIRRELPRPWGDQNLNRSCR